MHLIPREMDKLLLHGVGFLAQKRLARGLRLNHPEAVGSSPRSCSSSSATAEASPS
jgi:urease gamma subunit